MGNNIGILLTVIGIIVTLLMNRQLRSRIQTAWQSGVAFTHHRVSAAKEYARLQATNMLRGFYLSGLAAPVPWDNGSRVAIKSSDRLDVEWRGFLPKWHGYHFPRGGYGIWRDFVFKDMRLAMGFVRSIIGSCGSSGHYVDYLKVDPYGGSATINGKFVWTTAVRIGLCTRRAHPLVDCVTWDDYNQAHAIDFCATAVGDLHSAARHMTALESMTWWTEVKISYPPRVKEDSNDGS